MRDVESALLETEQFTQSHTLGQFVIEYDPQDPDSHIIVAGIPDGDHELLLEHWPTAVFLALPDASVEDAKVIETDRWNDDSVCAVQIRLILD